jgi:hypothetical protein
VTTFGKIATILFFLAYFAVRAIIDLVFVFLCPIVFLIVILTGHSLDNFEKAYNDWLFSGRLKHK